MEKTASIKPMKIDIKSAKSQGKWATDYELQENSLKAFVCFYARIVLVQQVIFLVAKLYCTSRNAAAAAEVKIKKH